MESNRTDDRDLTFDLRLKTVNGVFGAKVFKNGPNIAYPTDVMQAINKCDPGLISQGETSNGTDFYSITDETSTADAVVFVIGNSNAKEVTKIVETFEQKGKALFIIDLSTISSVDKSSWTVLSKGNFFNLPESYADLSKRLWCT